MPNHGYNVARGLHQAQVLRNVALIRTRLSSRCFEVIVRQVCGIGSREQIDMKEKFLGNQQSYEESLRNPTMLSQEWLN